MHVIKALISSLIIASLGCSATKIQPEKRKVDYQIKGRITYKTALKFKEDSEIYDIETVSLESIGGGLYSAMNIGAIIHSKGINTYVPEGSVCLSACGYIFMAGNIKILLGEVGMHEISWGSTPYHDLSNNAKASITEMHWKVANYLGLIGVHYYFFKDSMETFSENMKYVKAGYLNKYVINGYLIIDSIK